MAKLTYSYFTLGSVLGVICTLAEAWLLTLGTFFCAIYLGRTQQRSARQIKRGIRCSMQSLMTLRSRGLTYSTEERTRETTIKRERETERERERERERKKERERERESCLGELR